MKKLLSLIFMFSMVIAMSAQDEVRNLKPYDKVKVSGGINLQLYNGNNEAHINVTKGDPEDLKLEVKNGTLHIKFEKKSWSWNGGSQQASIKLYGAQNIEGVEASAGSNVHSDMTIHSDGFDVQASSGANVDLVVECMNLNGNASSGGNLSLEGSAKRVTLKGSSGGNVDAKKLEARMADAKASSGGAVKLWVTETFSASAGSGGLVKYKGNPETKNINVGKYSGGSVSAF